MYFTNRSANRNALGTFPRNWNTGLFQCSAPRKSILGSLHSASYVAPAATQIPPPRPPADSVGLAVTMRAASTWACEPHRSWIESQVQLGRNAVSIYKSELTASSR